MERPTTPIPGPGEHVAVLGLGVSNRAVARYLLDRGIRPRYYDRKPAASVDLAAFGEDPGDRFHGGPDYLDRFAQDGAARPFDWIFVTPGMPKDLPELRDAAAAGARLTGEMSLFMNLCPAPMIGITGSAGKTTTASLTAHFLRTGERRIWLGGNIGEPLLHRLGEIGDDDLVVLELSSFQLELAERVPASAAVLNLSPDHLDVHGDAASYYRAKSRLVTQQQPGDTLLLNWNCPRTRALARVSPARVRFFAVCGGRDIEDTDGVVAYAVGDDLRARWRGRDVSLISSASLGLRGEHNRANFLAAATLALDWGVAPETIRREMEDFRLPPHRLEEVDRVEGVRFVDDSIATSPPRTRAALVSYSAPLVVILGGYDKGVAFGDLAADVAGGIGAGRIRAAVVTGACGERLAAALEIAGAPAGSVDRREGFEDAFAAAVDRARPGDVVLLSPGCASFDAFENYRARGQYFKELVANLKGEDRPEGLH